MNEDVMKTCERCLYFDTGFCMRDYTPVTESTGCPRYQELKNLYQI